MPENIDTSFQRTCSFLQLLMLSLQFLHQLRLCLQLLFRLTSLYSHFFELNSLISGIYRERRDVRLEPSGLSVATNNFLSHITNAIKQSCILLRLQLKITRKTIYLCSKLSCPAIHTLHCRLVLRLQLLIRLALLLHLAIKLISLLLRLCKLLGMRLCLRCCSL